MTDGVRSRSPPLRPIATECRSLWSCRAPRSKRGAPEITEEKSETELREWAPELSDETLGPPDIVLVATDFGPQVTNTAMFLYENGLRIRLIQVRLYRTDADQIVLTTSQLLPVPAAETFMVRPKSAPAAQAAARAAREYRASVPERLIAQHALRDGQHLRIVVPPGVGEDRETVGAWLAGEPSRAVVTWQQDPRAPVTWQVNGQAYNLTTLIRHIITEATGTDPRTQVWGPNWYRDDSGRPLHKIADAKDDTEG